jgi:hypothetical protein
LTQYKLTSQSQIVDFLDNNTQCTPDDVNSLSDTILITLYGLFKLESGEWIEWKKQEDGYLINYSKA